MDYLSLWWVWIVLALGLAILEVTAPAQIFLGFAVGAGSVGIILAFGGPVSALLSGSMPLMMLVFAIISLVAWLVLRPLLGVRAGQAKHFEHDINEE